MKISKIMLSFLLLLPAPLMAQSNSPKKRPVTSKAQPRKNTAPSQTKPAVKSSVPSSTAPTKTARPKRSRSTKSQSLRASKPRESVEKKNFMHYGVGLALFQERMKASSSLGSGVMLAQSQGFLFEAGYHRPRQSPRWQEDYEVRLGLGSVKGSISDPLGDRLTAQNWALLSLAYGYTYKTSVRSGIGLHLPLIYRKIDWKLKTPISFEDKSFTYGLAGSYVHRMSMRSSFVASIEHQMGWETTLWSLNWQYDLK